LIVVESNLGFLNEEWKAILVLKRKIFEALLLNILEYLDVTLC
jgi:hypothetical protein